MLEAPSNHPPDELSLTRPRFERWVRQYARELYGVCLKRVGGNRSLAEELVADVWLVAWNKRADFSGDDEGGRRWLHRITWLLTPRVWRKNPATAELTPEMQEQTRLTLWSQDKSTDGGVAEDGGTEVTRLHLCFQELQGVDQDILQMRFGLRPDPAAPELPAGLAWAEIAEQLQRFHAGSFLPDQMRMRANRSMLKLKQCIERGGHQNPVTGDVAAQETARSGPGRHEPKRRT